MPPLRRDFLTQEAKTTTEVKNDEIIVATGDVDSGVGGVCYASLVGAGDNHGDIRGGIGSEVPGTAEAF